MPQTLPFYGDEPPEYDEDYLDASEFEGISDEEAMQLQPPMDEIAELFALLEVA